MAETRDRQIEDSEELVAYLDGELDAESARKVEDRLTHDFQYRELLQNLERSWDLLDDLPSSSTDDSFVQSTLEMVAIQTSVDLQKETGNLQKNRLLKNVGVAFASAVIGILGYQFYLQWLDRDNTKLLNDIRVIERVDMYQHIDDFEFLNQLADDNLFGEAAGQDEK